MTINRGLGFLYLGGHRHGEPVENWGWDLDMIVTLPRRFMTAQEIQHLEPQAQREEVLYRRERYIVNRARPGGVRPHAQSGEWTVWVENHVTWAAGARLLDQWLNDPRAQAEWDAPPPAVPDPQPHGQVTWQSILEHAERILAERLTISNEPVRRWTTAVWDANPDPPAEPVSPTQISATDIWAAIDHVAALAGPGTNTTAEEISALTSRLNSARDDVAALNRQMDNWEYGGSAASWSPSLEEDADRADRFTAQVDEEGDEAHWQEGVELRAVPMTAPDSGIPIERFTAEHAGTYRFRSGSHASQVIYDEPLYEVEPGVRPRRPRAGYRYPGGAPDDQGTPDEPVYEVEPGEPVHRPFVDSEGYIWQLPVQGTVPFTRVQLRTASGEVTEPVLLTSWEFSTLRAQGAWMAPQPATRTGMDLAERLRGREAHARLAHPTEDQT